MNWKAMFQKFVKHCITAVPTAVMPVLLGAERLSQVDWDKAGLAIVVGIISSGALGAGINAAQGNTPRIVALLLPLLLAAGASGGILLVVGAL